MPPLTNEQLLKRLAEAEKRADSLEDEKRELEDEKRRLEDEKRRLEDEKRRLEDEKRRLEDEKRRLEDEKRRLEDEKRNTTLFEYIISCHQLVFSKLRVQTNKRLTTQGSIPAPHNKWCPNNLQPWVDFIKQQRFITSILVNTFPPSLQARVFENKIFLTGLGDRIHKRPIGNEKAPESVIHTSVEDPVRIILNHLRLEAADHVLHRHFDMGGGIIFENHPFALSEISDEVIHTEAAQAAASLPSTPPSRGPNLGPDLNRLRPDQICIYRAGRRDQGQAAAEDDDGSEYRVMIYICEYKPPHKLTAAHLRLGLRPMHPPSVASREKLPADADPDTRFQYYADLRILRIGSIVLCLSQKIHNWQMNKLQTKRAAYVIVQAACPAAGGSQYPPHSIKVWTPYPSARHKNSYLIGVCYQLPTTSSLTS